MDEKIMEISFGIISFAGEAKFMAKEAIEKGRKFEFAEARNMIEQAKETLNNAHRFQTELITNEANGVKNDINVILIHSQDHLMTTMSYIDLAEEFINMYEFVDSKIK